MKSNTRILHVAWLKARYGGAHKYLDRLVQRLIERQCQMSVVVNQQDLNRPFLDSLARQGVDIRHLSMENDFVKSGARMDRIIDEFRPDIVHFNSGAKYPRKVADNMSCWKGGGFQSIFTMHLPLVRETPRRLARVKAKLPWTNDRKRMFEKAEFANRFDRIISVSERFAESNVRLLRLDPRKVVAIPNGVDLEQFQPKSKERSNATSSPVSIGGCGGLVPQKRFDLLIQAVSKLERSKFIVRIAGEGSERAKLERMIHELGLSENVQLVGHQSDIPTFLKDLDIFVMSSDFEAFPYSQLEAMATGLPSVVTDVGDLPLMVRQGADGLVVPAGDAKSLAAALSGLIEDEVLRKTMGASARDRVCSSYEQYSCETKTLELFDSVLL